jgi:hypothetical protein
MTEKSYAERRLTVICTRDILNDYLKEGSTYRIGNLLGVNPYDDIPIKRLDVPAGGSARAHNIIDYIKEGWLKEISFD